MLHEPVMDPPRHWQTAADPRGCIMDPVMTRLDIAKLPRVFEDGASTPHHLLLAIRTLAAGLWGCVTSTATPRVKVGKLSLILLDGP